MCIRVSFQTGKSVFLYLSIAAVLATLCLFGLERMTVTPREEVRATLNVIAHELEQNNADAVLSYVSEGRPEIEQEGRLIMAALKIEEVDIKNNLQIDITSAKGMEIAEARFNCVFDVEFLGGQFSIMEGQKQKVPRYLLVRFKREADGVWRVREYEHRDPREGIGQTGS